MGALSRIRSCLWLHRKRLRAAQFFSKKIIAKADKKAKIYRRSPLRRESPPRGPSFLPSPLQVLLEGSGRVADCTLRNFSSWYRIFQQKDSIKYKVASISGNFNTSAAVYPHLRVGPPASTLQFNFRDLQINRCPYVLLPPFLAILNKIIENM